MKEQFLELIKARKEYIKAVETIENETNIRIASGVLNIIQVSSGLRGIADCFGCMLSFKERDCKEYPIEASFFFDDFEIIQLLEVK